jgi:hypothetical protein
MAKQPDKPAPKLQATKTRIPNLAKSSAKDHEEEMIDEAVDESFPASDPPSVSNPSSTLAVKHVAETGRATPEPEIDPAKKHMRPIRK